MESDKNLVQIHEALVEKSANDEITFDVSVIDNTETMSNLHAELFSVDAITGLESDTGLVQPLVVGENLAVSFTGLEYGATYVVKIVGDYNDNYESDTIIDTILFEEETATVPLIEITEMVVESLEVHFTLDLNDQFGILDDEELTKLRGVGILSLVAPKIGAWGAGKLATLTGLKLIPWVVKVSGSPNAAEAMKYLTSKAVQTGIIAWMGVGEGKKWLEDTLGIMITGVGSLPGLAGTVFDALKAVQQTATGTGGSADLQKQRDLRLEVV